MKVQLNDGSWTTCLYGLKSHAYSVDTDGSVLDPILKLKFNSVGEILAYVEQLDRELEEEREKYG